MAEITKVYRQDMGARRLICKRYYNSDRVDGHFGAQWDKWHENGWFDVIKKQTAEGRAESFEDASAAIGFMREDESGKFEYSIGMFAPKGAAVPEGFQRLDFENGKIGVCWVYGNEGDVFMKEELCANRLKSEGYDIDDRFCFERYTSRFDAPDEKGNQILDVCYFLK